MPVLQLKRQEDILQEMINWVVGLSELTDITDSSVVGTILDATARQIDNVYLQFVRLRNIVDLAQAGGDDLHARAAEIVPGTLRPLGARRAIGRVVFSRPTTAGTTAIPAGTVVRTADGTAFTTVEDGIIAPSSAEQITGHGLGRDSAPVAATAVSAGVSGNVGAGTTVIFGTKPPGITEVTNVTAFSQGRDAERDDDFRARVYKYVASLSRCTVGALETIVRGLEDPGTGKQVIYSRVFEDAENPGHVTLYIDDGAGTAADYVSPFVDKPVPCEPGAEYTSLDPADVPIAFHLGFTLKLVRGGTTTLTLGTDYFVNPASGRLYVPLSAYGGFQVGDQLRASYTSYTGLIPFVQKVVDGDPNDRATFPGCRAAGVLVEVRSPAIVPVDVTGAITTLPGFDQETAVSAAESAVLDYINNLGIGEDVIRSEIIQRVMDVEGVYDVNLTLPVENIIVLPAEVARTTLVSVIF